MCISMGRSGPVAQPKQFLGVKKAIKVIGSPASMRLTSGMPDYHASTLTGQGLSVAVAGKPAVVRLQCVDACNNPTLPDEAQMRFGLAMVREGEWHGAGREVDAWRTVDSHKLEVTTAPRLKPSTSACAPAKPLTIACASADL